MLKTKAIELLGGSTSAAATAIGISYQAVDKWPDVLPPRIADRVYAAIARKAMPELEDESAQNVQPALVIAAQAATKPIARTPSEDALSDAMQPILLVSAPDKPGDRRSEVHPPAADLERRENEAVALVRAEEDAIKKVDKYRGA